MEKIIEQKVNQKFSGGVFDYHTREQIRDFICSEFLKEGICLERERIKLTLDGSYTVKIDYEDI